MENDHCKIFFWMDSQKVRKPVTPAKAGVQRYLNHLDSRLCGNDKKGNSLVFTKLSFLNLAIFNLKSEI